MSDDTSGHKPDDKLVFSLFHTFPVHGVGKANWPTPPSLSIPADTRTAVSNGIEIARLADEVGFDYVTLAEHHYSPDQLSPNPLLWASLLSQHLQRAGVAVLGATLPLVNPLRAAEEIAVVDAMLDGKLLIGMFRGTPNEFLTYGTNPGETREMFEEAVQLIINAWTQPEPFAWFGRHYEYRTVSVWPRPVSLPFPKVLISANSAASAAFAARHRFKVGVAFAPPPRTAELVSAFRAEAQQQGWAPAPSDILHRSFCVIAETDAEAERMFDRMSAQGAPSGPPGRDYGVPAELAKAIAAGERRSTAGPSNAPPVHAGPPRNRRPYFLGSPDTVIARIRQFAADTGVGHFDLVISDSRTDYATARRSIELFGREVIPALNGALVG